MAKLNNTTRFVLPMLVEDISFRKNDIFDAHNPIFFQRPTYINAYLSDINKPNYENKILLKYEYDLLLDFPIFERKLEHLSTYVDDYDDKDGIVYVFNVPDKWKDDYNSFKAGKYSQFSYDYKHQVLDFWNLNSKSVVASLLLNKTEHIRNYLKKKNIKIEELNNPGELWYKPGKKEILNSLS